LLYESYEYLPHILCAMLLISRIGDVVTTYLVTPNLVLEANPIARVLGWRFAIITLGACLVPYVHVPISVSALVLFLMVSAANARQIWFARAIGEREYAALIMENARKSKLPVALASIAASACFTALVGGTILYFYPDPEMDWGFWIGIGVLAYAGSTCLYGSLATARFFRLSRSAIAEAGAQAVG
jgi:hypothetical protein